MKAGSGVTRDPARHTRRRRLAAWPAAKLSDCEEEDEALLEGLDTCRRWRLPPTGAGLSLLQAVALVAWLLTVPLDGLR
jgi:hypothetical protein